MMSGSDYEIIEMCRAIAKAHAAADQQHEYTKAEDFVPHAWVLQAMRDAYKRGINDAIAGHHS